MDKDQARQLNAKIQLDSKIRKKAERLLRQMARDFEKLYAEKGVYLDFNAYAEKWQRLLARHYKNVQDEFIGVASEELDVPMSRDKMALFILALQIMREQRASASSRKIIDTSTEQMADSISKAELYMQQESMPISNDAVAALALEIFGRKIESRATTIAMTETQYVAETVKNIEADCLTNNKNIFLVQAVEQDASLAVSSYMTDAPIGYEKEWLSALLPTTRPSHAAAHGQKVAPSELFYVGGEYLKYPGDTSMGATAGNVVNCYCAVRYNK
jgi:hypothetical protein